MSLARLEGTFTGTSLGVPVNVPLPYARGHSVIKFFSGHSREHQQMFPWMSLARLEGTFTGTPLGVPVNVY